MFAHAVDSIGARLDWADGEILVTASDEFVENRARLLPQNERVMHVFLTLNLGLIIAVCVPVLLAWSERPTDLVRVHYGLPGWLLLFFGLASAAWSVRDGIAFAVLHRGQTPL